MSTFRFVALLPVLLAAVLGFVSWSSGFTLPAKSKNDGGSGDESPEMILLRIEEDRIEEAVTATTSPEQREIILSEDEAQITTTPEPGGNGEGDKVDPLSVVWYLGAFGGLIAFFLVVTCSEWCCGRARPYSGRRGRRDPYLGAYAGPDAFVPRTPPPPYHLFAPPDYQESLKSQDQERPGPKSPSIFIIPVSGST